MENVRLFNNSVEKVYVCGDIHGEFTSFFNQLKLDEFHNSAIIVAGDCGFGFYKPEYYTKLLDEQNKQLIKTNTYVYFVRGNHDDPSYFDIETVHYSNIIAIPDYTILTFNEKNILCVGGGISIDRRQRINYDNSYNKILIDFGSSNRIHTYWPNEAAIYNEELIPTELPIHIVVSHSAPSFVYPQDKSNIQYWIERDDTLESAINDERQVFDRIYDKLKNTVTHWYYGHFHNHNVQDYENTTFVLCDCNVLTKIIPTKYENLAETR